MAGIAKQGGARRIDPKCLHDGAGIAFSALCCICKLLASRADMNTENELLEAVVPLLDHKGAAVRARAYEACCGLFQEDGLGGATQHAVRLIAMHVKARQYVPAASSDTCRGCTAMPINV